MKRIKLSSAARGFTLAELLVSSALIVAIMGFILTTVDQTRRTINGTMARVSQFQSARVAFENMTRTLSQATLNTYYDLDRSADPSGNPLGYRRQSDLHFVSGRSAQTKLLGTKSKLDPGPTTEDYYPGHCVFFQAPLGVTAYEQEYGTGTSVRKRKAYSGLSNLLSVVGYYVKWGEDPQLPRFLGTEEKYVPKRLRYRLMQVNQPAETVMVYSDWTYMVLKESPLIKATEGDGYFGPTEWIHAATGRVAFPNGFKEDALNIRDTNDYSRVLAENIVALIIVPKVPEGDRVSPDRLDDLTSDYEYDSCPKPAFDSLKREFTTSDYDLQDLSKKLGPNSKQMKQLHQLPPIVQVTMIAIDEESGAKLQAYSDQPPDWTTGKFNKLTTYEQFLKELGDPANPDNNSLVSRIGNADRNYPTPRLNYRVFTADVVLRGSKWSK